MSDPLDLVQLRTLVAIADCGGFHRAAAALHLSQSTVSQHVRLLERKLRRPLVERVGRGSRFTPAGERLLVEARTLLAVHDQALERLEVGSSRTIVVGCTEHAADGILPELLTVLGQAFPDRGVRFRLDRSSRLGEAVSRGLLDLAVVLAGDDTVGTEVGTLPLVWYAAPGFTTPAPGEPWPLVAFEEPCGLRRRALAAFSAMGAVATLTAESTSLDGVVAAARAGVGVALLPHAGRVPEGLVPLRALPAVGDIGLRVVARRGVDVDWEAAAGAAARTYLAHRTQPHSLSVPA